MSTERIGPVDVGNILSMGASGASKKLLPSSQDINQLFSKEGAAAPDKKGPVKIKLSSGAKFFKDGPVNPTQIDASKLKAAQGSEQAAENSTRPLIRQPNRAGAPLKQGLRMQIKASNVRILSKKPSGTSATQEENN